MRQRVAKLESLAATLEVDQDVALSDLPRCVAQVEEVRRLQGRQSDLRCELDRIIDRRSPIDAAILEPFVATARNVTRFLDTYGDSPRGTLLEVITRSESRRSLEAPARRSHPYSINWGFMLAHWASGLRSPTPEQARRVMRMCLLRASKAGFGTSNRHCARKRLSVGRLRLCLWEIGMSPGPTCRVALPDWKKYAASKADRAHCAVNSAP